MKLLTVLFVCLVLASAFAQQQTQSTPQPPKPWPQEPTSFKTVPFGSPEKAALNTLGITGTSECMNLSSGERFCDVWTEIGDVAVKAYFVFEEDKLVTVLLSFDADRYEYLRSAFIEKYGPAHSSETKKAQNRMGAEFTNETLRWSGQQSVVTLSRYGSKFSESEAEIGTREYRDRKATEAAEKAKAAADDM